MQLNSFLVATVPVLFIGFLKLSSSSVQTLQNLVQLWTNNSQMNNVTTKPPPENPIDTISADKNFSLYTGLATAVNHTVYGPYRFVKLVGPYGNYSLIQTGLLTAVGALATGAGIFLLEALKLHEEHKHELASMHEDQLKHYLQLLHTKMKDHAMTHGKDHQVVPYHHDGSHSPPAHVHVSNSYSGDSHDNYQPHQNQYHQDADSYLPQPDNNYGVGHDH